jgi:hypothetical protein
MTPRTRGRKNKKETEHVKITGCKKRDQEETCQNPKRKKTGQARKKEKITIQRIA